MSNRMRNRSFLFKLACVLISVAGLWLLGARIWSPHSLSAYESPPPPLTFAFQSPIGNPELSIVKSVNDASPQPGNEITYTLACSTTNPGSQVFNARVYDFLPAGVQYLSSNPPALYQNGALLFTVPTISTTNKIATVRVRVREGYEYLRNHTLTMADFVAPANTSLMTQVDQPPAWLRLTKKGYKVTLLGGELVYTLRCENPGSVTVNDVTVVDVLPTALPLVGASPPPDVATLPLLQWSLGDLHPGESRTIVVTTTAPASFGIITLPGTTNVITNTALADARQRVVTQTMFATQVITQGAILRVAKKGSAPEVTVGDQLVYTLQYENAGNESATGVVLTDTLPTDVTVMGVAPSPVSTTTQQIVWELGTLNPGDNGKIVITTTVGGNRGRTLHNVALIAAPGSYSDQDELDTPVLLAYLYMPLVTKNF